MISLMGVETNGSAVCCLSSDLPARAERFFLICKEMNAWIFCGLREPKKRTGSWNVERNAEDRGVNGCDGGWSNIIYCSYLRGLC